MKSILFAFFFITSICRAQSWQGELMTGVMAYNGDLTQKEIPFNRLKPAASLKLIYNSGDFINFRLGLVYGHVSGDDKKNTSYYLTDRNLSFESAVAEVNFCAEFNLFDPEFYNNYPYVVLGVGMFHFNPYAFDKGNKKTFLQPLSTEGQGLKEYPDRKEYSLYQFCLPVGAGFRMKRKSWEFGFEFGYRVLFTDYLDDVSKNYVSMELLTLNKGPKAGEMAFRSNTVPFPGEGEARGNPKVKDNYFFAGLRFTKTLGKKNKKKDKVEKREEDAR